MEQLPALPESFNPKKFWEKPEGTAGMIMIIGLIVLGIWALPYLITLAENVIYLGVMTGVIALVLYVLFDRRWRMLFSNMFKSLSRKVAWLWATVDPIGIMKNYLDDFIRNKEKIDGLVQDLAGEMGNLKKLIDTNEAKKMNNLNLASAAKKRIADNPSMKTEIVIKMRKAGRLENSNMRLSDLYKKMEMLYRILRKMLETLGYMIEDLDDEITNREIEYKAIKKAYSAFKMAMRQAQGSSDEKEMFEMAMEYQAEDYGRKLGEIEHMIDMSSSFMRSVDLQNCVFEEDGMKMLEDWEKKTDSFLLTPFEKQDIINRSHDDEDIIDLEAIPVEQPKLKKPAAKRMEVPRETDPGYEKLFK